MHTRGMVSSKSVSFLLTQEGRVKVGPRSTANTFITRTRGSMYCRTRELSESYEDHKQVRLHCAGEM